MLENLRHIELFGGDVVLSSCRDWCRDLVAELPPFHLLLACHLANNAILVAQLPSPSLRTYPLALLIVSR